MIESEAIRKHCVETNYELNTWQCLYLVWDNGRISLEKRHALYEEIMKTMPEPQIPETYRECLETDESVYKLLKEQIKKEKKEAEKFLKSADEPVYEDLLYEDTLKEMIKSHKRCLKENIDKYEGFEVFNRKIKRHAWITYNGKIGKLYMYTSLDNVILSECTRFPVPFKYGDIVCYPSNEEKIPCIYGSEVEGYCHAVSLYTLKGGIITEELISIKNLNILNDKIGTKYKFIKVLSDFLKGKIDVVTMLNAYVICFNRAQEEKFGLCIESDYLKNIIDEQDD